MNPCLLRPGRPAPPLPLLFAPFIRRRFDRRRPRSLVTAGCSGPRLCENITLPKYELAQRSPAGFKRRGAEGFELHPVIGQEATEAAEPLKIIVAVVICCLEGLLFYVYLRIHRLKLELKSNSDLKCS